MISGIRQMTTIVKIFGLVKQSFGFYQADISFSRNFSLYFAKLNEIFSKASHIDFAEYLRFLSCHRSNFRKNYPRRGRLTLKITNQFLHAPLIRLRHIFRNNTGRQIP